jgi:hypothetical protein
MTTSVAARIAAIDAILAGGTSSVTIGDRRVDYDLDALRAERDYLLKLTAGQTNSQIRKVVFKGGSAF